MNKKSLIAMLVALCLVAAVGVGATLAYFTDKADTRNIVTMGHVNISIFETKDGQETTEGLTFENVLPGQTFAKDPTIRVEEGSADCYIRAKVEFEGFNLTDEDKAALLSDIDESVWTKSEDGYYYYNEILSEKAEVKLFEKVTIPGENWGNDYADASFEMKISAEAIQAEYLDVNDAKDAFAKLGGAKAEVYTATTAETSDNE